jgi:ATP synthase protein I
VRADLKAPGGFGTVGLEIVLAVTFGTFGGHWLDGRLGTEPWLMLVGAGFGIAAAARFLWRATRRLQHATNNDGFDPRRADRPARFALDEKERKHDAR